MEKMTISAWNLLNFIRTSLSQSPVIAKLFENILLLLCESELDTNPLQFGFCKTRRCCRGSSAVGTAGGSPCFRNCFLDFLLHSEGRAKTLNLPTSSLLLAQQT